MRVRIGKERFHTRFAHRVVPPRNDLIQIDKPYLLSLLYLTLPSAIVVGVALDLAILPYLARYGRTQDWMCAFGQRIGHIPPHVPAIGIDRLVLFHDRGVDLFTLITHARNRPACTTRVIERSRIVMAKLEKHKVPRLEHPTTSSQLPSVM